MSKARTIVLSLLLTITLFWLNAYIARDLFTSGHTGKTNSMHGYWTAMARHATLSHWFSPNWWPYWDAGMPFEWTYAPLVPALTALRAHFAGVDPALGFGWVSGLFYCLTPVTLFVCSLVLSRQLIASFAAALFYSLAAPTEWLYPDGAWNLTKIGDARRLYLMAAWDETPHVAALTFLPLVVLFTALALRRGGARWWIPAAISMALSVSANAFGATAVIITLVCVLLAWAGSSPLLSTLRVGAAGLLAWLLIAGWLPLSELGSMRAGAESHGHGWSVSSWTALTLVLLVATVARLYCVRTGRSSWATFVTLFAATMTAIPATYAWLNREFLPQSGRYKIEAEMALALLLSFGLFRLVRFWPVSLKAALCAVALSFAAEQTVAHRKYEKQIVRSADMNKTIEARVAHFFQQSMPNARVAVPGSIAQWLNYFGAQPQFAGSSWATAYNPEQQRLNTAWQAASTVAEATRSLALLREYGVEAYAVPGRASPEFWKAVAKPEVYAGCDALWIEQDTRICALPQEGEPMAKPADGFRWLNGNEALITGNLPASASVSVRVTWHPGWHAFFHEQQLRISRDHLGLIAVQLPKAGPYEIHLVYDGGTELKLTRWLMYTTWLGVLVYVILNKLRASPNGPGTAE